MKAQFHRVASSRSFTRSLSIVAVAVVAFAALELFAAQPVLAGIVCCTSSSQSDCLCDPSLTCSITSGGKFYGTQVLGKTCWNTSLRGSASTIKSTIECKHVDTPSGIESESAGTTILDSTSLKRSGFLECTVTSVTNPSENDTAFCKLDLSYSRPAGLTTCTNHTNDGTSTLTYGAFCQDAVSGSSANRLSVTGTLKCGPEFNPGQPRAEFCVNDACTLNLGIAGASSGACSTTLFPPDGKVLSFSQTVDGPNCGTGSEVIAFSELDAEYCNGGTFDNAPVACISGTGKTQQLLTGIETSDTGVQFDVAFSPTTLNLNCGPNNNDTWNFTISANQHLTDLTRIVPASLAVEGVPGQVTCDDVTPTATTRTCHVKACQPGSGTDIGPVACANSLTGTTADLTVTGSLDNGTLIIGEDKGHKTTGCQK
jgi:hypothetical protein